MMKTTQCERILRHLRDYGSITQKEAYAEYGIARLASRINDLKKKRIHHYIGDGDRKKQIWRRHTLLPLQTGGMTC